MAQSPASRPQKPQDQDNDYNEFYEAMPLAGRPGFTYHDSIVSHDDALDPTSPENARREAKVTAIITLTLVALSAVVLGLILVKGLQTMQDSLPVNGTSSAPSSLEL